MTIFKPHLLFPSQIIANTRTYKVWPLITWEGSVAGIAVKPGSLTYITHIRGSYIILSLSVLLNSRMDSNITCIYIIINLSDWIVIISYDSVINKDYKSKNYVQWSVCTISNSSWKFRHKVGRTTENVIHWLLFLANTITGIELHIPG